LGFVFVMVFGLAFGIGGLAIILEHFQKMAKIRSQASAAGAADVAKALDAMRKEIADLRDTTTRYDLSFDSALQRLESRVAHLEESQRARPGEQASLKQTV